jgi:hypothetical protein
MSGQDSEVPGGGANDDAVTKEELDSVKQTLIADLSAICDVDNKTAESMLLEHNWNMQVRNHKESNRTEF